MCSHRQCRCPRRDRSAVQASSADRRRTIRHGAPARSPASETRRDHHQRDRDPRTTSHRRSSGKLVGKLVGKRVSVGGPVAAHARPARSTPTRARLSAPYGNRRASAYGRRRPQRRSVGSTAPKRKGPGEIRGLLTVPFDDGDGTSVARQQGRCPTTPVPPYCTAFTMSKIGRYMATIMPPTTTPRKTIMIGSRRLSRPLTAASTSSS